MRSIRVTLLLLLLASLLALGGCQRTAGNPAPSNAAASNATQPATSAASSAQPAPASASTQPTTAQTAPASAPAQPSYSAEPAPAAGAPPAQPAAPAQPSQAAQTQPADSTAPAQSAPAAPPPQPAASTAQAQPAEITLPHGTPIEIRLNQTIGSARSERGQTFTARLDEPIVVEGAVVVPQGANVTGRVLFAKRSGRLRGPAELTVTLTSLEVGGQNYRIVTTHKRWSGKSHKKRDIAWMGGGGGGGALVGAAAGGGVGAAIGAGVGFGGGTVTAFVTGRKDIVLPAEYRLRFVLRQPVTVTES